METTTRRVGDFQVGEILPHKQNPSLADRVTEIEHTDDGSVRLLLSRFNNGRFVTTRELTLDPEEIRAVAISRWRPTS